MDQRKYNSKHDPKPKSSPYKPGVPGIRVPSPNQSANKGNQPTPAGKKDRDDREKAQRTIEAGKDFEPKKTTTRAGEHGDRRVSEDRKGEDEETAGRNVQHSGSGHDSRDG